MQEYRDWVDEAKGNRGEDGNSRFREAMMIVADIDDETEKMSKLKRQPKQLLAMTESMLQEARNSKGNK